MNRRPTIGVTGPDRGGLVAWLMTALALRRAGARALRIRPGKPRQESPLDGLVIGGGTDVDPFHYGEEADPPDGEADRHSSFLDWLVGLVLGFFRALFAAHTRQGYDPARDQLEKAMIERALAEQLPILGICRGAQLLNVVLGGSLYQDIGHFYTEETSNVRSILPRKAIAVATGSHLQDMLGVEACFVNALHNQSIKQLGEDVVVSAREPNGVVQAIEKRAHPYFIGVQWHPEYMPQSETQQRLFRGLVRGAKVRTSGGAVDH